MKSCRILYSFRHFDKPMLIIIAYLVFYFSSQLINNIIHRSHCDDVHVHNNSLTSPCAGLIKKLLWKYNWYKGKNYNVKVTINTFIMKKTLQCLRKKSINRIAEICKQEVPFRQTAIAKINNWAILPITFPCEQV